MTTKSKSEELIYLNRDQSIRERRRAKLFFLSMIALFIALLVMAFIVAFFHES